MNYLLLKHLHISCVFLSGLGFLVRGVWMWAESPALGLRWVRIVPHVVDSVLLASALAMAVHSGQYPFALSWLTAKFFGLLAYIVLGAIALKRGKTLRMRRAAFLAALLAYAYIVSVALTRSPLSYWG